MRHRFFVIVMVVLATLLFVAPISEAEVRVLLLPDLEGESTAALIDALWAAGYTVEVGPIEYLWDGANPPLDGIDVVIHLNGATWRYPLPVDSQIALTEFVRAGGGYIGGQWNGFEPSFYDVGHMADLVLQLWPQPDNCEGCEMTWTVLPGQEDHPVLAGIPDSFTFFADGHDAGSLVIFDEYPSQVIMTTPEGGPAVIVRELKTGRVVSFALAPNYLTQLTLHDEVIQRLYVNSVAWTAALPAEQLMLLAIDDLVSTGAIDGRQANALTSKIEGVLEKIDRGQINAAINQMWAFVNQVEAWIRSGKLTLEEAQPLLDLADSVIAKLSAG